MFLPGRWYTLWACLLRSRKREQCFKLPIHKILSGEDRQQKQCHKARKQKQILKMKATQPFPFLSFRFVCFVCLDILPTWIYVHGVSGADGGEKRLSDLVDLEIWMVVSHHLGELNQGPLWEQYVLLPLIHLSSPKTMIFQSQDSSVCYG